MAWMSSVECVKALPGLAVSGAGREQGRHKISRLPASHYKRRLHITGREVDLPKASLDLDAFAFLPVDLGRL